MGKFGLVFMLCVVIISGCSISDSSETAVVPLPSVPRAIALPSEAEPKADVVVEAPVPIPAPAVEARVPTRDDIRRMQLRMREVGFDPGPIDGIAGMKTKAALRRFDAGCAQVRELIDAHVSPVGASVNKWAERTETLALQRDLQAAGFNPGPADGIFGVRTKTVLTHLQNGCPSIQEFAVLLDQPARSRGSAPTPKTDRPLLAKSDQDYAAPAKQLATPNAVRPQEEVRMLQRRLRDAGFDPGPYDGVMGPKTKLALERYQASQQVGKSKLTAQIRGYY